MVYFIDSYFYARRCYILQVRHISQVRYITYAILKTKKNKIEATSLKYHLHSQGSGERKTTWAKWRRCDLCFRFWRPSSRSSWRWISSNGSTTTFRPKIRRPYCRIFDTSLLHVRHYDFFLSVGGLTSVIRHLFKPSVKRHLSYHRLNVRRRLSDMENRRWSDGDKKQASVKRHGEPSVKRRR